MVPIHVCVFSPCLSGSSVEMVQNLWDVCKQLVRRVSHSTSLVALERVFENRDFKTYISYFCVLQIHVWYGCLF